MTHDQENAVMQQLADLEAARQDQSLRIAHAEYWIERKIIRDWFYHPALLFAGAFLGVILGHWLAGGG